MWTVFSDGRLHGWLDSRLSGSAWKLAGPIAALLAASALLSPAALGQQARPSEYQVKAVYLFNFSRFVTWPAALPSDSAGPFAICVLGKDPFGPFLDATLAGEGAGGRAIVARRMGPADRTVGCQILYISSSEEGRLREILAALENTSVLTVSDIAHFAERGGMIQFVLQDGRVRFEVNLGAATGARLTLSSNLLKVAAAVRNGAPRAE